MLKISEWRSDKLNHKVLSRGRNCDVRLVVLAQDGFCSRNATKLSLCCTNKLFVLNLDISFLKPTSFILIL